MVVRGLEAPICLEVAVDLSDEVAFEEADGFAVGFAAGGASGDVFAGVLSVREADEGDAVDGGVALSVAASVESVSGATAGGCGDWCDAEEVG